MENQWLALVISFGVIILVIGVTTIFTSLFRLSEEASRKMIHIGVGNWIILAMYLFDSLSYLLITPVAFIVINYVSYRFNLIKAMEREDSSFGTVWYAVSLSVLAFVGFWFDAWEASVIGILIMAYGDGFAAVLGKKYGVKKWFQPYEAKSLVGSITMFGFSFFVTFFSMGFIKQNWNLLLAVVIAGIAVIVELISKNGFDNLSVPLVTAAAVIVYETKELTLSFFILMIVACLVLFMGYKKRAITFEGMVHGLFVAVFLYYFGDAKLLYALILFFVIGSVVSAIGKRKKELEQIVHERSGARGIIQVYANSGGAMIMVVIGAITGDSMFNLAALITFVAALADTVSSEIGMLSKKDPISILTFKKIQQGLSGGVSLLGIMAGLFASLVLSYIMIGNRISDILLVTSLGFLGSIIDSVIGAAFQAKYYMKENNLLTEKSYLNEEPLELKSGFRRINNDMVNFISTFLVSCLYVGIQILYRF